jgi:methanogenic corrinoid protein MtbC1
MADNRFTASLLRASADGLAGIAASRLLETEPGFAGEGFEAWRGHLRTQLGELAAAVEDESPELFAERVAWSRDAFVARTVPVEALSASVASLREVCEESLPAEACAPLAVYFESAAKELECEKSAPASAIVGPHAAVTIAYVEALARDDDRGAVALVTQAMDGGLSARDVIEHVLGPAQREIGRKWHAGELSVAEEHLATTSARRVLERAVLHAPEAAPNGKRVLVASVAGDAHDLGVRLVAAYFELEGWRTYCLGADMPSDDLAPAAQRLKVDLVALGATLGSQRESAEEAVAALRAAHPELPVIVGGPAFSHGPSLWQRIGADGYASSPSEAVELAQALLSQA